LDSECRILKNDLIAPDIYRMEVEAPEIAASCNPGQFVNLYTGDNALLLPRPISISLADKAAGAIHLVYRVQGRGTALFAGLKKGEHIRAMGPLGTGFPIYEGSAVLIGGGLGAAPLLELARSLRESGPSREIKARLGYSGRVFLAEDFRAYCDEVLIITGGASPLDGLEEHGGHTYACGPGAMLGALAAKNINGLYLSLEERMACGFGVCLGCAVEVKEGGYKRVCKDGPVFAAERVGALSAPTQDQHGIPPKSGGTKNPANQERQ
jgi:dihydroorotate dehydrogenase electron transfer subunit